METKIEIGDIVSVHVYNHPASPTGMIITRRAEVLKPPYAQRPFVFRDVQSGQLVSTTERITAVLIEKKNETKDKESNSKEV